MVETFHSPSGISEGSYLGIFDSNISVVVIEWYSVIEIVEVFILKKIAITVIKFIGFF